MKCQICEKECDSKTALAAHLRSHDISSEEYTIKYIYDGERPLCPVCDGETKYCSFEFDKFCGEHKADGPDPDRTIKDYPRLMKQWSSKNNTHPAQVAENSAKDVYWECEKGHVFQSKPYNRTRDEKPGECPCCSHVKLCLNKTNSLKAEYPDLAKQWAEDKDAENVLPCGKEKKKWECEQGHTWMSTIDNRIHNKTGCPKCNGGRKYSKEEFKELKKDIQGFEIKESYENYKKKGARSLYLMRCLECGEELKRRIHNQKQFNHNCPNCHDYTASSKEKEIRSWLKSEGLNNLKTNLNSIIPPYEVDIYLPEYELGIEYHGLYWHSEECKSSDYHQKKFLKAQDRGITLLQFFEDQWRDKRDICKSIILHELEETPHTIYARECSVERFEGGSERVENFFKGNHLMGAGGPFREAAGLVYEGELVSCLTVRRSKHYEADEILRFAHKKFHHIPGALSRLLSRFDEPLVTYVDLMHGDGTGYKNMGFKEAHKTDPNYWYTDFSCRIPRQRFQATDDKSERQLAQESGVSRIYGAGNLLLKKY